MRYLSVCSGIEAATVAWHHMGWTPVAFSDIEPFPSAVLTHHYPHVPNLGDMTKFEEWNLESVDLLVGGTPCQSFSVAGLRKGLADPRGNLMLTFLAIAQRQRPRWIVWENVPGVLSSNGGRDFGTFLGALGELGYGFAYRVLDAQWFGVAQRRRRVFVVGCVGDWQRPAEVLFKRESVRRDTAPSREARQETAKCIKAGVGKRFNFETETLPIAFHNRQDPVSSEDATNALGAKDNGLGVLAFSAKDYGADASSIAPTLRAMGHDDSHANGGGQVAVAQTAMQVRRLTPVEQSVGFYSNLGSQGGGFGINGSPTLKAATSNNLAAVATAMQVRRLTPVECERLQGFPDNYTNIPWRKAAESPDGPRYKALGNSMAVPVMRWIGERINKVNT
jgi:DNA (cytosine-5)-methyltransferase 1